MTDVETSEQRSRAVAESARETTWQDRGFLREIFLGNFRFDWIESITDRSVSADAESFFDRLVDFLESEVDSARIDADGKYPERVIEGLKQLGAFGMKIPSRYGGLGLNYVEYERALEICGQYDGNIVALLSAHQSIGVPQPLMVFGTDAQKEKYLKRCAEGAVSAFALTEPDVGSDPASLSTRADKTPDGDYVLTGEKLWCTNGTFADVILVMARDPETDKISAFIVETDWPGVEVRHRCHFMGLRAIENGVIGFDKVRVPKENLVGKEGEGLKIALVTLNVGRLALPAACVGVAKRCTQIVRHWANERVQWGQPIGKHEAITHQIADIAATAYAIESMTHVAVELSMREGYDIRLEAASAKEWATVEAYRTVDQTLQVRGGRGYETETSLAARGEPPIGVERMLRDTRINTIFEGSSEIMHLFMAREAVDKHLTVAGSLIDPKKSVWQKLASLPKIVAFYAWWYPSRWLGFAWWPKYSRFGRLGRYLRYAERAARRLARSTFHGMLRFGPKLEKRQAFLFRVVDVANEIFVLAACVARAHRMTRSGGAEADSTAELTEYVGRRAMRRIDLKLRQLWHNDDAANYRTGRRLLDGELSSVEWLDIGQASERAHALPASHRKSWIQSSELSEDAQREHRESA